MSTLTPSSSLRWTQECDFVLLVDERSGKSQSLRGSEAALWNWLHLGYTQKRIVRLLAALLDTSAKEAETELNNILIQWHQQGWLENEYG